MIERGRKGGWGSEVARVGEWDSWKGERMSGIHGRVRG